MKGESKVGRKERTNERRKRGTCWGVNLKKKMAGRSERGGRRDTNVIVIHFIEV